jgi:phosphoglycerol transferase MdoB-like AlkP superfamily enzyme
LLLADSSFASKRSSWVLYFLFYAVWANIPYWIGTKTQGLVVHGWFCFDYLAVGVISLFLPRLASAALLGTVMFLDLLASVCETYYIAPSHLLFSSGALWQFSPARILGVAGITSIVAAVAWSSLCITRLRGGAFWRARAAVALISFSVVCLMTELVQASMHTRPLVNPVRGFESADVVNLRHFNRTRPARYPVKKLIGLEMFEYRLRTIARRSGLGVADSPSATAIAVKAGAIPGRDSDPKPDIVLIVVESWGLSADVTIRNSLVSPYTRDDLAKKYEILQGAVPFYGPTVSGEVRALCSSKGGFEVINAPAEVLQKCLPDRLGALGYRNIALHGMDGHLFNRNDWYPKMGFDEVLFRDSFQEQGLHNCPGAFPGTCDANVADWIGDRLEKNEASSRFIYWMTLNSHLPLPNPPLLQNPAPCSITNSVRRMPALCSWYQLEDNVHQAIADLARRVSVRPTVFIVVGDHAPPFSEPELRNGFSDTLVPYLILIPTRDSTADKGRIRDWADLNPKMPSHTGG